MAYDAAKAHEYYVNYRKKGLKKGRKKGSGSGKKSSTASLLGTSTSGLNDEGKIQAGLIKEKLKKEMNEALKKAGSDEEREQIRVEYSRKAIQQLAALKNDSKYAKPTATKSSSGSKSSKSSSGSSKSSTSKSSGAGSTKKAASATVSAPASDNSSELSEEMVLSLVSRADKLMSLAKTMPPEMKKRVATTVESIIKQLNLLRGE